MWRRGVIALALTLGACTHAAPPAMTWVRTDGQKASDNPALAQQGEIDKTVCIGDAQRVNLSALTPVETSRFSWGLDSNVESQRSQASMDAIKGCMAQKGYVLVPVDQAEAVREQFAATAAQKVAQAQPPVAAKKPRNPPQPSAAGGAAADK